MASRSRSRSKGKKRSQLQSKIRSKLRVKSKKRSRSHPLPKLKQNEFTGFKPVCSMRVQFFSDIHHRLPYSFEDIPKTHLSKHIGQRKLLLTELYFLAEYAHLSNLIIYVGAAPGHHISILADFFPKHIFHLYDDRDYHINEKYIKSGQIVLFKQYFTNEDVEQYKYKNVLFISDIRNMDVGEANIMKDMNMQKRWILDMKPIKSMVKFRMPYGDGEYCMSKMLETNRCTMEYLNGKILLQPWAPIASTEGRLIVDQYPTSKTYDCIEREEKSFYHNIVTRNQPIQMSTFNKKTGKIEYKKYTWDYMQECAIIRFFKMKYPKYKDIDISQLINKLLYTGGIQK